LSMPVSGSFPLTYSFWASMMTTTDSDSGGQPPLTPAICSNVLGEVMRILYRQNVALEGEPAPDGKIPFENGFQNLCSYFV
jgi:hypothetical protein